MDETHEITIDVKELTGSPNDFLIRLRNSVAFEAANRDMDIVEESLADTVVGYVKFRYRLSPRKTTATLAQGYAHGADVYEPAPIRKDNMPAIWDIVIEDMRKRDAMGRKKHGGPLVPFDGRDALWDAYQESLDQTVYLRKAIYERDGK